MLFWRARPPHVTAKCHAPYLHLPKDRSRIVVFCVFARSGPWCTVVYHGIPWYIRRSILLQELHPTTRVASYYWSCVLLQELHPTPRQGNAPPHYPQHLLLFKKGLPKASLKQYKTSAGTISQGSNLYAKNPTYKSRIQHLRQGSNI